MKAKDFVTLIALILVVTAALNLLMEGLFSFNMIEWMFGGLSMFARVLYVVVGVAGVWLITDAIMMTAAKRKKT